MNDTGKKMAEQHIDNDTLAMFVKITSHTGNAGADENTMSETRYHEVLDHLTDCEECRNQVTAIST